MCGGRGECVVDDVFTFVYAECFLVLVGEEARLVVLLLVRGRRWERVMVDVQWAGGGCMWDRIVGRFQCTGLGRKCVMRKVCFFLQPEKIVFVLCFFFFS